MTGIIWGILAGALPIGAWRNEATLKPNQAIIICTMYMTFVCAITACTIHIMSLLHVLYMYNTCVHVCHACIIHVNVITACTIHVYVITACIIHVYVITVGYILHCISLTWTDRDSGCCGNWFCCNMWSNSSSILR